MDLRLQQDQQMDSRWQQDQQTIVGNLSAGKETWAGDQKSPADADGVLGK
jgi:hypothetical protein